MDEDDDIDVLVGDFSDIDSIGDEIPSGDEDSADEDDDMNQSRPNSETSTDSHDSLTSSQRCFTPPTHVDCGVSHAFVSKFERVRVLGIRAAQIARSCPSGLEQTAHRDPLQIAEQEMNAGLVPLTIQRRHHGIGTEVWNTRSMLLSLKEVENSYDVDAWKKETYAKHFLEPSAAGEADPNIAMTGMT